MAKTVEINFSGGQYEVSWATLNGTKRKIFVERHDAERYADEKMGKRGCVVSTLDMTPEQLEALKARQERAKALMAEMATDGIRI